MTAKLLASGVAAMAAIGAAAVGMTPVAMASTGQAGIQTRVPYAQDTPDDSSGSTAAGSGSGSSDSAPDGTPESSDNAAGSGSGLLAVPSEDKGEYKWAGSGN